MYIAGVFIRMSGFSKYLRYVKPLVDIITEHRYNEKKTERYRIWR